ncbi:MAG: hypothetical protein L6R41_006917 [Letrouitia leprolyta]|nr:MAG: hypothetical protein L6R41_006917 [Letrouitia leprolyta]
MLLDPPKHESVALRDLTIALISSLAFLGPVGELGGVLQGAEKLTSSVKDFSYVLNDASQREGEGRINELFYQTAGDPSTQLYEIADLRDNLGTAMEAAKDNLQNTIERKFSADPLELQAQNSYLWYIFNTHIISKALNGNNIYGAIAADTDPRALAMNSTRLNYQLHECQAYNDYNITGPSWYNNETKSAYGLNILDDMKKSYADILPTLLDTYTTGDLLFESARRCDALHKYDQPLNLTLGTGGSSGSCIPHLRIVTWDMDCVNPINVPRRDCEFVEPDVPRQGGFLSGKPRGPNWFSYETPET